MLADLTDEEFWIWFGGWFDAEGSIYTECISMTQSGFEGLELLSYFKAQLNIGAPICSQEMEVYYEKHAHVKNRGKAKFSNLITTRYGETYPIMKKVYPYLVTKKNQADVYFFYQKVKKENKGYLRTRRFRAFRREISNILKILKRDYFYEYDLEAIKEECIPTLDYKCKDWNSNWEEKSFEEETK